MDQDTEKIISGGLLKFVRFTIGACCSFIILFLMLITIYAFMDGFRNGFTQ
ncbi:hypothetical protein AGMMS50222_11160 [Endomicrobiia bacterium]|nr:hypothetical protein AGMMS49531_11560 [Endomicrobiia bacterium]GHT68593.1 hypothetical protein AGMMS49556_10260 [Endomicrobiia bacterium]GHT72895.1 hypothetical protein AGMMS49950_11410 [Endomicrobiia bacterium]GHT77730.1 hypothetical protein AGMMS50222_11160 [Endomicrobiia bacterium]